MKTFERNIIWSNFDIDLDNWEDVFSEYEEEQHCRLTTSDKRDLVNIYLEMFKEDESLKLNFELNNELIDVHDVPYGYEVSEIKSKNIKDIFTTASGLTEWYSDGRNVRCSEIREQGIFKHCYRSIRPGYTADYVEKKLNSSKTPDEFNYIIRRYTNSIYPMVASVYGW